MVICPDFVTGAGVSILIQGTENNQKSVSCKTFHRSGFHPGNRYVLSDNILTAKTVPMELVSNDSKELVGILDKLNPAYL
jgi:hypothetical protein